MVTDKISDLIIQIKNAGVVDKESITVSYSKLKNAIVQKLRVRNYLKNVEVVGHGVKKKLLITLLYNKNGHIINDFKRVSKPSKRVYVSSRNIENVKNGNGIMLLSTPKGILTGEEARKECVGGEILFLMW